MGELQQRFARHRATREARRSLERFSRLRGRVLYRTCDVTRPAEVEAVVQEVARTLGRLDLVVHGAGLQSSKRLDRRRLAELRQNLEVKLAGVANLHDACERAFGKSVPFHALTSAFSFFGNDGQADYGAANETLDRLCELVSARRGRVAWSSIGWLAWDGVGMTNASEYRVLGGTRKLHWISREEGKRLFLDVVGGRTAHPVQVQLSEHERAFYGIEVHERPDCVATDEVRIDAASGWCADHLVRGAPTLPGAWALDLMLGTARKAARANGTVLIAGGRFARFLKLKPGASQTLRIDARPSAGGARVRLVGDIVHRSGIVLDRDVLYAEASFSFDAPTAEVARVAAPCDGVPADDPYCVPGADVELRGRFDSLRNIRIGSQTRSAEFAFDARAADKSGNLPTVLLDAAWRLGAIHAAGPERVVYAAMDFERIGVGAALVERAGAGQRLFLRATRPRVEGATVYCDRVEATDERGNLWLFVEGGRGRRIDLAP
jgi:hypothetical protein